MTKLPFRHPLQLFFLILCIQALYPTPSLGREALNMYVGEVKVIALKKINRVAIGNPKVASNTILPNGQLVLLGDNQGLTTMHIWLEDGSEKEFDVLVKEKADMSEYRDLSSLLAHMPGVSVSKLDDLLVVKGRINQTEQPMLARVLEKYKDALNLTTVQDSGNIIHELLRNVPNVQIRDIGDQTVIFGEVTKDYAELITKVTDLYPNVLNMTRTKDAVADKMVYMSVRIMEINKSITEQLGIKWNLSQFMGPRFELGVESTRQGGTLLNADGTSKVLTEPGGDNLHSLRGYFGIASSVSSILNLAEQNGDAVLLAEPKLSTRSGGKAEFLAGGEIPMPVTNAQGQVSVMFKKYGIMLNVAPVVDEQGNILASVETEVSTIDDSVKVDGIPGLLSRKTTTEVNLRPRQTLVIAGLVQDLVSKNYDNVKWLSDIPVLGPLFQSKDFKNKRSELVIFLTPSIYDIKAEPSAEEERAAMIMQNFDELTKGKSLIE